MRTAAPAPAMAVPIVTSAVPLLLPNAALSVRQTKKLANIAGIEHYAPGDYLFHAGEPVQALFTIVTGVAKLIGQSGNYRPVVFGFAFSNDILGQFSPPLHTRTAQAITALSAYRLPHDRLNHLLHADERLRQRLLSQVCADLRLTQAHLIARRAPAPQRIAAFLLCLHQRANPDPHDPTIIPIPMRRIDIADFLALSTASLRRILHWFQTSELIDHLSASRLRILNRQALNRLAMGSPPDPHPFQGTPT